MRVPVPGVPTLPRLQLPRVEAALDAVLALERSLRALPEELRLLRLEVAILADVRQEVRGMREDVQGVIGAVDALRDELGQLPPDVRVLRGAFEGMDATVGRIAGDVDALGDAVGRLDRMAGRVAHPLRRRERAGRAGRPTVGEELAGELVELPAEASDADDRAPGGAPAGERS